MANGYPTKCTECGREIIAPFKPSLDKTLRCPLCQIMDTDMTQTQYVKNLITVLSKKLGSKITVPKLRRARGTKYTLILEKKGEEPEIIVIINWIPKDSEKLMLPQIAIAEIQAKKPEVKEIIKAFIKEFGIESSIPPAMQRY